MGMKVLWKLISMYKKGCHCYHKSVNVKGHLVIWLGEALSSLGRAKRAEQPLPSP